MFGCKALSNPECVLRPNWAFPFTLQGHVPGCGGLQLVVVRCTVLGLGLTLCVLIVLLLPVQLLLQLVDLLSTVLDLQDLADQVVHVPGAGDRGRRQLLGRLTGEDC